MKNKLLSAPLRVYWSIAPHASGGLDGETALSVARELASLKVFFVTLTPAGGPRPDICALIGELKKGGTRVVLSVSDAGLLPREGNACGADVLDLCPRDIDALRELLSIKHPDTLPVSLSVVPMKGAHGKAAEMFAAGIRAGIRTFNLANPRLVDEGEAVSSFVLDEKDRSNWKFALEMLLGPLGGDVRLFVHDLFLHQELKLPGLGGRIEYAGCQAGDAIAYISNSGMVYPCASWPEPVGDLRKETLKDIWSGEPRKGIRARVGVLPAECVDCPEAEHCKGGCRGLAWHLTGCDTKDPGCVNR